MKQRPSLNIDELTKQELQTLAKNLLKTDSDPDEDSVDYFQIIEEQRARQKSKELEGLLKSPDIIAILEEYLIHLSEKESRRMIGRINKLMRTNSDLEVHLRKIFTSAHMGELNQDDLKKFEVLIENALSPEDSLMRKWEVVTEEFMPEVFEFGILITLFMCLQLAGTINITKELLFMALTSVMLSGSSTALLFFFRACLAIVLYDGAHRPEPNIKPGRLNQRLEREVKRVLNAINETGTGLKNSQGLIDQYLDGEFEVFLNSDSDDKSNQREDRILGTLGDLFES